MPSEGVAEERASELTATQRSFLESFQAFVHEEAKNGSGPKKTEEELRPLQIIFLIALAIDVTLLYLILLDVFPNVPENRGVVFFLQKVLPALGGTLLVSYFKRLRAWLLEVSKNKKVGIALTGVLGLLVLAQAPIYSVLVEVRPRTASVAFAAAGAGGAAETADFDDSHRFLRVPKLRSYDFLVQDGTNPQFPYHIGAWSVLKGALAGLPFLDQAFKPLPLAAAYRVSVNYEEAGGELYISAPEEFRLKQSQPFANTQLDAVVAAKAPAGACVAGSKCWRKMLAGDESVDHLVVPAGNYRFTQRKEPFCTSEAATIEGEGEVALKSAKKGKCK